MVPVDRVNDHSTHLFRSRASSIRIPRRGFCWRKEKEKERYVDAPFESTWTWAGEVVVVVECRCAVSAYPRDVKSIDW